MIEVNAAVDNPDDDACAGPSAESLAGRRPELAAHVDVWTAAVEHRMRLPAVGQTHDPGIFGKRRQVGKLDVAAGLAFGSRRSLEAHGLDGRKVAGVVQQDVQTPILGDKRMVTRRSARAVLPLMKLIEGDGG